MTEVWVGDTVYNGVKAGVDVSQKKDKEMSLQWELIFVVHYCNKSVRSPANNKHHKAGKESDRLSSDRSPDLSVSFGTRHIPYLQEKFKCRLVVNHKQIDHAITNSYQGNRKSYSF